MELTTKEIVVLVFFMVLLPVGIFFALRRARTSLRITFSLIVFIMGAIAAPNFMRPRVYVSQNACVNNLQLIQKAKHHWAEVNHKSPTDVPTMSDLFNPTNDFPFNRTSPSCPAGGTYTVGAVNEDARCSIGPPQHTLHPSNVIYQ
jgi:hypothetical protein